MKPLKLQETGTRVVDADVSVGMLEGEDFLGPRQGCEFVHFHHVRSLKMLPIVVGLQRRTLLIFRIRFPSQFNFNTRA